jgi:hypothetical protein
LDLTDVPVNIWMYIAPPFDEAPVIEQLEKVVVLIFTPSSA